MPNITEDLRRYQKLSSVYKILLLREFTEPEDPSYPDLSDLGNPTLDDYWHLHEKLSRTAIESPSVVVDDTQLHRVFEEFRKKAALDSTDDDGLLAEGGLHDRILSDYNPNDFGVRLIQIKPVVTTLVELPEGVVDLLDEARRAYCLRLCTACISVCRSVIEYAVVDIAIQIGRTQERDQPHELRMCSKLSMLIEAKLSKQSPTRRALNKFMDDSSRVIHNAVRADDAEALRLYSETVRLLHTLYGNYRRDIESSKMR